MKRLETRLAAEMAEGETVTASIHHQINRALEAVSWSPDEISKYQQQTGVISVKKSLRPGGDPTKPLPIILGVSTKKSYNASAGLFFTRAKMLTEHAPI